MKTIKSILIAATLICATAVSTVSAQRAAQPAQKHEFTVAIGDSVMIKRECQKYLTGETPSTWVWDKVHTVRQLGTKRFPDGVLLMNIYSWMCEDCLIEVNGHAKEAQEKAQKEQAEEKAAFEQNQRDKKLRESGEKAAENAEAAAAEAAEKEQAEKEAKEAEKAAEKARKDSIKQEKADSIEAEKRFKSEYDRFTIGLRGGASALMHHAEKGNWACGGDVVLDLQYAHYWSDEVRPVDLGLIVGLGIGYEQSGLTANEDTFFTVSNVDYTVVAKDIKETDHQLQLEVPVMFSLIHENGLFFNVGPKFMIPLYTPYKQTVNEKETHISAYFPETGITIQDNPVTGQYTGQQPTEKNGIQFNINVMLTAEIGYEWLLKSGNSIGLGAYANYGWNLSYKNTPNPKGLFDLNPPTDYSKGTLDVLSATHAYADKLSYFDAGIKLAYHFNFPTRQRKEFNSKKLY